MAARIGSSCSIFPGRKAVVFIQNGAGTGEFNDKKAEQKNRGEDFKKRARKEIEKLTAMNVVELDVVAKNIYVPEKQD